MQKELKEKAENILKEKNALNDCIKCGNDKLNHTMADEIYFDRVHKITPHGLFFDKDAIPYFVLVCSNCGFMNNYAIFPLGFELEDFIED